jgi:acetyltransferase-like isoleucine patch superfamily enzyme
MSLPPFSNYEINASTLLRCRHSIEGTLKRALRSTILPLVRLLYGFASVGEGFQWGWGLNIRRNSVRIGKYAYLGNAFECSGPLLVGDLCMVSTNVRIVGNDHKSGIVGGAMRLEFNLDRHLTVFESECWIGMNVTIREGVTIGRGAVVGAGSVVTKDVSPYTIVAGVPAKLLATRFKEDEVAIHDRALYG